MTTTIGQLVAALFEQYEHRYHDEKLAAVATQVTVDDLMPPRPRRRRDSKRRSSLRSRRSAA